MMLSRLPAWPRALHQALLRTLLPVSCALCGQSCAGQLCAPCRAQFFGLAPARCAQCANLLPDADVPRNTPTDRPSDLWHSGRRCARCLAEPPPFDATLVAVDYAAPVDQLVLQLKFGARLALAGLFAQLLRDAVLERPGAALPELLCPVPLGPRRLAERGFNQALEIARPLAAALGIALYPALAARAVETEAQARQAPAARRRNIEHAFVVPAAMAALLRERHVGIVDDVMTSGQTLAELGATFKRHGAARVTNLVFARTPPRERN